MSGARRADSHARRVLALLAGNANVLAICSVAALAFDLVALKFQNEARAALGQLVGLIAGLSAVAAANALVLVKDHHIVRLLAVASFSTCSTPG